MRVVLGLLLTCWLPLVVTPQRSAAQALSGAEKPRGATQAPHAQNKLLELFAPVPDAFVVNKRLGRGVNVLGYDPIWQDRQKARFQGKYFGLIQKAGFNHIRVNLHPFRDAKLGTDGKLSDAWLDALVWTFAYAQGNRLMLILDFHEFEAMGDDPASNKDRFLAVWRQIAEYCKDFPDDVLFEILNEPNKKLTAAVWNPLLREALAIIRQSNPRRMVIVGPTSWNAIDDLDKLDLPEEDRNLIVTVHYYSPFSFTHQGAAFAGLKDKTGVAWDGTEKEQQAILKDFDKAQAWAEKHHRPIYLGEFGVYDKADMAARVRWASFVSRQAEKRGWSWAWWQFEGDFVLYDVRQEQWVEPLRQALVPPAALSASVGGILSPYAKWHNGPGQDTKPFPIAVWLQDPRNAAKYEAIGINLFVGLWEGPTAEQIAELKRYGMPVICNQNDYALKHLDEKTIVGWMHGDEPDNAQDLPGGRGYGPPILPEKIADAYRKIKEKDSTRPVMLNLGQGVAWDDWYGRGVRTNHPEDYAEYVRSGDIISFDIYPVVHDKPAVAGKLWYVARGVERLRGWADDRIVWNCVECTRISNANVKPTPQQVKAEVWMSIIYGSQGLIYFCHQFQPKFIEAGLLADEEMAHAVGAINREIHDLTAVINSPSLPKAATVTVSAPDVSADMARLLGAPGIAIAVKKHQGATFLFAVRMEAGAVKATFHVEGMYGEATVRVIGENRTIPVRDGRFEDDFATNAVHLYQIIVRVPFESGSHG